MKSLHHTVLISGTLNAAAVARMHAQPGLTVVYEPECPREKLLKLIRPAHVVITRSETNVDQELIDCAPELKVIARAAVGVSNIDIAYATKKGILVVNTPGKNTNSAAELTVGLLLAMFRKLPDAHAQIKKNGWDRHKFVGRELRHKKIGLVGLGNVGHRVAKFCRGFDMEVYAYDPYISPQLFARHDAKACNSLDELARQVDILSVHTPLNNETQGMVSLATLQLMPPGSFVINAARGGIVDEHALLTCLDSGQLAGAAIDTWENEPKPRSALALHPKVWCSPHIGASTEEAQEEIGAAVVEQVLKSLNGGIVDYPINLPEVGLITSPLVSTYVVLAQKLGSLCAQLLKSNPVKVELSYGGNLAGVDQSYIRLGWITGFTAHAVDGFVSFVNATQHFDKLGVEIIEGNDPQFEGYRSAITTSVLQEDGRSLTVGGIVFDDTNMRISQIDDFHFEVEPHGEFLLIRNSDQPGVIGGVGTLLAKAGINIDSFNLSRRNKGGEAMGLIKVDGEITASLLKQLTALSYITGVNQINF
jgi:D-3-phosphoglycerate dehydrogenase